MAREFKQVTATEAQIEAARSNSLATFATPPTEELTISGTSWVAFTVDGTASKRASLVITFEKVDFQLFAMSLLKKRIDYNGNPISVVGIFNLWMLEHRNKWNTIADMEKDINTLKEKKIKTIERTFFMRDKNGEVRSVTFYEWDFIK